MKKTILLFALLTLSACGSTTTTQQTSTQTETTQQTTQAPQPITLNSKNNTYTATANDKWSTISENEAFEFELIKFKSSTNIKMRVIDSGVPNGIDLKVVADTYFENIIPSYFGKEYTPAYTLQETTIGQIAAYTVSEPAEHAINGIPFILKPYLLKKDDVYLEFSVLAPKSLFTPEVAQEVESVLASIQKK